MPKNVKQSKIYIGFIVVASIIAEAIILNWSAMCAISGNGFLSVWNIWNIYIYLIFGIVSGFLGGISSGFLYGFGKGIVIGLIYGFIPILNFAINEWVFYSLIFGFLYGILFAFVKNFFIPRKVVFTLIKILLYSIYISIYIFKNISILILYIFTIMPIWIISKFASFLQKKISFNAFRPFFNFLEKFINNFNIKNIFNFLEKLININSIRIFDNIMYAFFLSIMWVLQYLIKKEILNGILAFIFIAIGIALGMFFGDKFCILSEGFSSTIKGFFTPWKIKRYPFVKALITLLTVYIFVVLVFSLWFYACYLEDMRNDAYFDTKDIAILQWWDFIYFSFATITTLDCGYISPIHPFPQSLVIIEVIIGIALIAVYLGMIMHVAGQDKRIPKSSYANGWQREKRKGL